MKEIDKKDLPEIGGGVWSDEGCIPPFPDTIITPPNNPLAPDPTAPLLLDL